MRLTTGEYGPLSLDGIEGHTEIVKQASFEFGGDDLGGVDFPRYIEARERLESLTEGRYAVAREAIETVASGVIFEYSLSRRHAKALRKLAREITNRT